MEKFLNYTLLFIPPVALLVIFLRPKTTSQTKTTSTKTDNSMTKQPIGVRNNNWLNIRTSPTPWKGEVVSDNQFEKFESVEMGLRAAMVLLKTFSTKYTCRTISTIISRWAPPTENNTQKYIADISLWTGFGKDTILVYDKNTITKLVSAMAKKEVGKTPTQFQLDKAWQLL